MREVVIADDLVLPRQLSQKLLYNFTFEHRLAVDIVEADLHTELDDVLDGVAQWAELGLLHFLECGQSLELDGTLGQGELGH